LVLLAEARHKQGGVHKITALFEIECPNVPRLYRAAQSTREYYQVDEYYGDPGEAPMMNLWAKLAEDDQRAVWPVAAPHVDEPSGCLGYHMEIVRSMLEPGKKRLYLSNCYALRGTLEGLPADVFCGGGGNNGNGCYPPIAALGYALSALVMYGAGERPVTLDGCLDGSPMTGDVF
jgi:hypothetical protein